MTLPGPGVAAGRELAARTRKRRSPATTRMTSPRTPATQTHGLVRPPSPGSAGGGAAGGVACDRVSDSEAGGVAGTSGVAASAATGSEEAIGVAPASLIEPPARAGGVGPVATSPAGRAPATRPSSRNASSASAIAPALTKRSAVSGAIALRSIASRAGGTLGRISEALGGEAEMRAIATDAAESPSHGRRPVSSSNRTIPRL